jgi:hypothetical protein
MQCDLWFPHEPLPLGHGQEGKPPELVMTSAFSGYIPKSGCCRPARHFGLLGGMWSLLRKARAVPKQLGQRIRDRPGPTDRAGGDVRRRAGLRDPAVAATGSGIRRHGRAMNRYFRQGFMPGRTFASPLDFNDQLAD